MHEFIQSGFMADPAVQPLRLAVAGIGDDSVCLASANTVWRTADLMNVSWYREPSFKKLLCLEGALV